LQLEETKHLFFTLLYLLLN
jgi:hypothetical protein